MALIKNAELHFVKCDPKRPNAKFNKKNPTWEVQIRTTDKNQRKEWEAMGLPVKAVVPDEGAPYWKVNLRKKSFKESGEAAKPVNVVNGQLDDIDPNTIGNGSIGHVRIYQYEYNNEGTQGIASILMAIQVVRHILYVAQPREDDFEMTETEVIAPAVTEGQASGAQHDSDDDDGDY